MLPFQYSDTTDRGSDDTSPVDDALYDLVYTAMSRHVHRTVL